MNLIASFLFLFFSSIVYAAPISIVPKDGAFMPPNIIPGYNEQAYYTITNNSSIDLNGLYVQYLPENVQQVTTNGTYLDTCGATFDLVANGGSGTLQFNISGPVTPDLSDPTNNIIVALPGGTAGYGTAYPLNIPQAPFVNLSEAFEIIYTANVEDYPKAFVQTYKAGGTNPISQEDWDDYTPPTGYTKNTTRYLQFDQQLFIAAPGCPNGVISYITTSDGYTWGALSNAISAMWPYDSDDYTPPSNLGPFYAGNFTTTPPAGVVKVTANYKAQLMKFWACQNDQTPGTPGAQPIARYYITDEWGNQYIMHASEYDTPEEVAIAFVAAILPAGWTKQTEFLEEDFILYPGLGADNTYEYTLIRDNQNNTYHQMYWDPSGICVATKIQEAGMPVWGGLTNDTIIIDNNLDNIIYGGGGANQFAFPETVTEGINTIIGFNPFAGDTLNFYGQEYTAVNTAIGVQIHVVSGFTVILSQRFTFEDSWVVDVI